MVPGEISDNTNGMILTYNQLLPSSLTARADIGGLAGRSLERHRGPHG